MSDCRTVIKTVWYVALRVGIHEGKQRIGVDQEHIDKAMPIHDESFTKN